MKRYKSVYIAGRLFNPFDRLIAHRICMIVSRVKCFASAEVYLPYRDSNMKVSQEGNVSKNIFEADIRQLEKTDFMIAKLDGMAYDSGVGFEIGYCYGRGTPVVTVSSDYYKVGVSGIEYLFSPLLDVVTYGHKYDFKSFPDLYYVDELEANIERIYEEILVEVERFAAMDENSDLSATARAHAMTDEDIATLEPDGVDVFIDFAGSQYEWCRDYAGRITEGLQGLNCYITDRGCKGYSADKELRALGQAKVVVVSLDEIEPNTDTSVIQGIAYANGKLIIGYETSEKTYFVEGQQSMHVNLMNEQACDVIVRSIDEVAMEIQRSLGNV